MEVPRPKPRQPVVDHVENWDDDDDFAIDTDDLTFRSSYTTPSNIPPTRRDSHGSHISFRSELESLPGEEKQVHLPGDDEKSTLDAIQAAKSAGIPIPRNVPPSALVGGTIKRLGSRKIQKVTQEEWGDDLELPEPGHALRIIPQDASKFPPTLRQVSGSSTQASPTKLSPSPFNVTDSMPPAMTGAINLDRFRDDDEDEDFFGDGMETIKVPKNRQSRPISLVTPPTPQKSDALDDDYEMDLELPSSGKLQLTKRRDIPKTPAINTSDDFWGEGSLGTRFGGTRRGNRSSSASALSPSVSSSITAESEDETIDGLVLPAGPINFGERLDKRRVSRSPERIVEEPVQETKSSPAKPQRDNADNEDMLDGLDLGDGEVFDSKKLTLNRNIKVKNARPSSPARPKTAVSLTFTSKTIGAAPSRLPRPSHERARSSLEPVSESGGLILARDRRSLSRIGGHSAHSSISSIGTPTTPSSTTSIPATPRRRELGQKTSAAPLRTELPHTTSAQLLRLKRSLPAMKAPQSPAKPMIPRYERPPSRSETAGRQSAMRPKTPVERRPKTPTEKGRQVESAAAQARRNPLPFLPAGASHLQSHHVTAKSSRAFRRHDSDNSIDFRPDSRAMSRATMRSPSPRRSRNPDRILDGRWRHQTKPARPRHFGDGHELDGFDDLPTSKEAEAKYTKQPLPSGPKTMLRNKLYQNILPDRTATPSPLTPYTPGRVDSTPHFARDTAASRIARETSLAQRAAPGGPLAPLTAQRIAQLSSRSNCTPGLPQNTVRSKKPRKPVQQKPFLIANLNATKGSKVVKGMCYNPETFRWEGNENALNAFEPPASSPSTTSLPRILRERENSTPRLGLITNINATKGVQVVGQMVFDPQNMCWLKMGTPSNSGRSEADTMDGFNALDDDDDDVFKDIPDLEDDCNKSNDGGGNGLNDFQDNWLVGEEFDVGPEFVRRTREEEERWKKKCEKWAGGPARDVEAWRWSIRDMIQLAHTASHERLSRT